MIKSIVSLVSSKRQKYFFLCFAEKNLLKIGFRNKIVKIKESHSPTPFEIVTFDFFVYAIINIGVEYMSYFGIFMIIFGVCVLLTGIYAFTGHSIGILTERPAFKNLTKSDWKNIGKWTIVVSLFIILIGILGIVFNFQ